MMRVTLSSVAVLSFSLLALVACGGPTGGGEERDPSTGDPTGGAPDPSGGDADDDDGLGRGPRAPHPFDPDLGGGDDGDDDDGADPPGDDVGEEPAPEPEEPPGTDEPGEPPVVDPPSDDETNHPPPDEEEPEELPPTDPGPTLPFPAAAALEGVSVVKGRDRVTLLLPAVEGARDYRAFVIDDDVTLELGEDGSERVLGATLHCAGTVQRNLPDDGTRPPARRIDVTGLSGSARIAVEAVDVICPFPGIIGRAHAEVDVTNYALYGADRTPFTIYTEEEVRARYGSVVVNGHRKGSPLGAPADDVPPRVLARAVLDVTTAAGAPPTSTFFSGFEDETDQPAFVRVMPSEGRVPEPGGALLQNDKFTFTHYGTEHAQLFIDDGQLVTVLADWEQDIMGSLVAYPRRAAAIDDTGYLHVTFEVPSNATARRYWWLSLCGASQPGQTLDEDGVPKSSIIQTPFFHQEDGKNPAVLGWSCLQLFPRDGWPDGLAPTGTRPQSDIRVMVNVAGAAERSSVRNVSPAQYDSAYRSPSWFRQQDASGALVAPMLDDKLSVGQKTRFDAYVRRDRVILFVDGEQRLCNDFAGTPLTMAEAAVGFGQVLYHSAAERVELTREYNDRTGQRYYLENTPYADVRSWDNLGYDEGVAAPAGFDESLCYDDG